MKRVLRCVIVALAVLGVAATASATSVIDFHPNGLGGSVVLTPDGRVTAQNLSIAWLAGAGFAVPIDGGVLAFDWGGANPYVTLTGNIAGMASGTLLSATLLGSTSRDGGFLSSVWVGDVGAPLANALGWTSTWFEFTTSLWFDGLAPVQPGTYHVDYYDVASVPEPGTMLLLGSGLFGVAAVVRRRLRR